MDHRSGQIGENQHNKHMINTQNHRKNHFTLHPPGASFLAAFSVMRASVGALASLLLVSQAPATPFSFSTGAPDGKIATLSRPSGPGAIQTETADDLLVTQSVVISQATFIGLLPP